MKHQPCHSIKRPKKSCKSVLKLAKLLLNISYHNQRIYKDACPHGINYGAIQDVLVHYITRIVIDLYSEEPNLVWDTMMTEYMKYQIAKKKI